MNEESKINPGHEGTRAFLRMLGPLLVIAGLCFMAVGLVSFFAAFGGSGPPRYFWCAFIDVPLLGVGTAVCKFAFLGAVARYAAGEVSPVARDTINYMADGTEDSVRTVARAVGEGLGTRTAGQSGLKVRCPGCNTLNDAEARFCDKCGEALTKSMVCPDCGELNDPDARFCDNCGRQMG